MFLDNPIIRVFLFELTLDVFKNYANIFFVASAYGKVYLKYHAVFPIELFAPFFYSPKPRLFWTQTYNLELPCFFQVFPALRRLFLVYSYH